MPDDLWERFTSGDEHARVALLERHMGLVHHVARKLGTRLSVHLDSDELVSAGAYGLMLALDAFDPTRGCAFATFAVPRIRGQIFEELRRQDHVPRRVRQKARLISKARGRLQQRLAREPRPWELARELDLTNAALDRWIAETGSTSLVSLDAPTVDGEDGRTGLANYLADEAPGAEETVGIAEQAVLLRAGILELKEQERVVLSLYYFEELRLREIAAVLGLTESRVSQVRSSALRRLGSILSPAVGNAA